MDGNGLSETSAQPAWTVEEATSHIASLEIDDLRRLLSDLSEKNSSVREAMQKHAKEQAGRPGLPLSSHSMSKKRRADSELDRTADAPAVTIVNTDITTTKALPPATAQGEGESHAIQGQTGLVSVPMGDLLETVQGVEETGLPHGVSKPIESNLGSTPKKDRKSKSREDRASE